ncbi:MAG: ferritin-like domain-containing protein [Gemmatimonadaceae bacterium]
MLNISDNDIWILSYYRESELAGGLVMGRLSQETEDDALRAKLTEHCAEETRHAQLWSDTLAQLGALPRRVRETYQTRYHERLGAPRTMLDVLALTQVFERRVVRHFTAHLSWPGTHPVIAATLRTMIAEEAGHISWVREWLDEYAARHGKAIVQAKLREYEAVDREIYAEVIAWRDRLGDLIRYDGIPAIDGSADSVLALVADSLGVPAASLSLRSSLASLGVNSLDLVLLVAALEERFRLEFEPADIQRLHTLGDLVAHVDRAHIRNGRPAISTRVA